MKIVVFVIAIDVCLLTSVTENVLSPSVVRCESTLRNRLMKLDVCRYIKGLNGDLES